MKDRYSLSHRVKIRSQGRKIMISKEMTRDIIEAQNIIFFKELTVHVQ